GLLSTSVPPATSCRSFAVSARGRVLSSLLGLVGFFIARRYRVRRSNTVSSLSQVTLVTLLVMSPLPPGPRSTLLHSLRYARDPFGSSLRALARYGDPFTAPTLLGPQVVTADPAV